MIRMCPWQQMCILMRIWIQSIIWTRTLVGEDLCMSWNNSWLLLYRFIMTLSESMVCSVFFWCPAGIPCVEWLLDGPSGSASWDGVAGRPWIPRPGDQSRDVPLRPGVTGHDTLWDRSSLIRRAVRLRWGESNTSSDHYITSHRRTLQLLSVQKRAC